MHIIDSSGLVLQHLEILTIRHIFKVHRFGKKIAKGELIPSNVQAVDDIEIPPQVLGDGAFPLRSWLMKPYGDVALTPDKRYFNYRSSRSRMVTEGASGELKGS